MTSPPTARGELPRFYELDPLRFQGLCRDIYQAEADVSVAEIFGTPGQLQRGVDIVATSQTKAAVDVAQCKCIEPDSLTVREIRNASKEFLKHLDYWKKRGVRRFTLLVAPDASRTDIQTERLKQRRAFRKRGIEYELWGESTIANKLRLLPPIVATYLGDYWRDILCGTSVVGFPAGSAIIDSLLRAQVESLSIQVAGSAEAELETVRVAWRGGSRSKALTGLNRLKDPTRWAVFPAPLKASIIRFEAQLSLENGDLPRATQLAAEAGSLDPAANVRLTALIARASHKYDDALASLEGADAVESRTLRAALLMERGRISEAQSILEALSGHPEAHRLRALGFALAGDMARARMEAQKTVELASGSLSALHTRAIVNYFSALSPVVHPSQIPPWPQPEDWRFVKADDDATGFLGGAAADIAHIESQAELTDEERRIYETWHLAALADSPSRRTEAESYCREVLRRDPVHYRLLLWAVARRLEVDFAGSQKALTERVSQSSPEPPEVIALALLKIQSGDATAAKALLETHRAAFVARAEESLWELWMVQSASAAGEIPSLSEPSSAGGIREVGLTVLRGQGTAAGDWDPLIAELRRRSDEGDEQATFVLCATLAELTRWDEAALLAERVIDRVSTADALSLGCIVLYNARQYVECLRYLETRQNWFPHSELPTRLQRLRLACLRELGSLRDATTAAEELLRLEPSTVHFTILADLYFEKGDQQSLVTLLRRHTQFDDLSNEALLRQSMRVAPENRAVATELWRRAEATGFSDSQVPVALDIGYRLALDRDLAYLVRRLSALAATPGGPARAMTFADAIQLFVERRESLGRAYDMYCSGRIPIHLAAHRLRRPISFWYHRALVVNGSESTAEAGPVLARSGWKTGGSVTLSSAGPTRLHADLTSILLAFHLGVLEHIEAAFRPIYLPHRFITAIAALRTQTLAHQPARHAAMRKFHDLVASGAIRQQALAQHDDNTLGIAAEQFSAIRHAEGAKGLVVEYQPFVNSKGEAISDLGGYQQYVRSPHDVIEALYTNGHISRAQHAEALSVVGSAADLSGPGDIASGSRLLCASNVLEALASGGVLEAAVTHFELCIATDDFVNSVTPELRAFDTFTEDAAWLGGLLERLNRGIDTGTYQVSPDLGPMTGPMAKAADESPAIHCLGDLLRFPSTAGDAIWADDRWVTSFAHRDGIPVVDTCDLLEMLVAQGMITKERRLEALGILRAGDVRFLALDVTELLARVGQAGVTAEQVSETKELRDLRRSYANALTEAMMLRVTSDVPEAALEWNFLLRSGSAVINAVVESWAAREEPEVCRARADWLLRNLYAPDRGRRLTRAPQDPALDVQLESVALSGLLTHAISFGIDAPARGKRRAYLQWIYWRLIRRRFQADASLKAQTITVLKTLLVDAVEQALRHADDSGVAVAVVHALIGDLPEELRRQLEQDDDFLSKLRITGREIIHIGPHQIVSAELWNAAAEAFRSGGPIEITAGDQRLTVRADRDSQNPHLIVADEPARLNYILFRGVLGILSDSIADRESALNTMAPLFDLPPTDNNEAIAQLTALPSVEERVRELARLQSNSTSHDYFELDETLRGHRNIEESDFIPEDVARLVRHLRLNEGESPTGATLDRIASTLISEVGIEAAFERLAGLPGPLSSVFMERLSGLSKSDRRLQLRALSRKAGMSPIGRAHVARCLAHFVADFPSYRRYIQRFARSSVKASNDVGFSAWREVLKVCADGLFHIESFRRLPNEAKISLMWAHGDRVFRIISGAGVDLVWVREHFGDWTDTLGADVAFAADPTMIDVAYPRRLKRLSFALATTAYASEGGHLIDESTSEALCEFLEEDPSRLIEVMQDLTAAPDAAASIVKAGISSTPRLVPRLWARFSTEALRPQVQAAFDAIKAGQGDLSTWAVIHTVVGDNPVHPDLTSDFRDALLALDLCALFTADRNAALMAATIATQQAGRLGREVVEHVRSEVVLLTEAWSKEPDVAGVDLDKATNLIASAAFYLFCRGATDANSFRDAAQLLDELAQIWPSLVRLRWVVDRLVEGLRNSDSRWFWSLQIKMRSTH